MRDVEVGPSDGLDEGKCKCNAVKDWLRDSLPRHIERRLQGLPKPGNPWSIHNTNKAIYPLADRLSVPV